MITPERLREIADALERGDKVYYREDRIGAGDGMAEWRFLHLDIKIEKEPTPHE